MKKIDIKSNVIPHLLAIAVFYIVTAIFFAPAVFKDASISQHDILQWEGGAKSLQEYRATTGEEGLWSENLFSGMPAYLVNTHWSNGIVVGIQNILSAGFSHPVRLIFLCFLSFYILLLSFKIRPYLAIGGALAFGLSSYIIIGLSAGHNARIGAIAFMPLVIAGIHWMFTGKQRLGFMVTALAMALELRVNHFQITYYLLLMVLPYGIMQLVFHIKSGEWKGFAIKTGLLLAAVLLAVGTFIGSIWGTYEYSKYSIRGKSELSVKEKDTNKGETGLDKTYAFQYSSGPFEAMTLFLPNAYGGSSSKYFAQDIESKTFQFLRRDQQLAGQLAQFSRHYWGPQPATAPYYIGAIFFLFLALAIVFAPKRYSIWLIGVGLLGIVLSMGSNFESFNYFMFDYFPGYNKFRSVTFALIMAIVAFPLLGCLGVEQFLSSDDNKANSKKFYYTSGAVLVFFLFLYLTGGFGSFKSPQEDIIPESLIDFLNALKEDRRALFKADAGRAFVFILLATGLLWAMFKKKVNTVVGCLILSTLLLMDSWNLDNRYFGAENFKKRPARAFFTETPADALILKDKSPSYRVLDLVNPWNDARTSYFHKSIGGYHGAKMRRYQDLVEYHINPEMTEIIGFLQEGIAQFDKYGVINMLNTRYFVAGKGTGSVIANQWANGNAWTVEEVVAVNSADEEIDQLIGLDTKTKAVIDQSNFKNVPTGSKGSISLLSASPRKLEYHADLSKGGLGVFSEIYYPKGWKAYIDGKETDILQVNYILRGLDIPQGQHKIIFEFNPSAYTVGNTIMLVSNILLLLIIVGFFALEIKNWRTAKD